MGAISFSILPSPPSAQTPSLSSASDHGPDPRSSCPVPNVATNSSTSTTHTCAAGTAATSPPHTFAQVTAVNPSAEFTCCPTALHFRGSRTWSPPEKAFPSPTVNGEERGPSVTASPSLGSLQTHSHCRTLTAGRACHPCYGGWAGRGEGLDIQARAAPQAP